MNEQDELKAALESLSSVSILLKGDELQKQAESYLRSAENYLRQGSSDLANQALQSAYSTITDSSAYRSIAASASEYSSAIGLDGAQTQELLGGLVGALSDGSISKEERNRIISMSAGLIGTAACAASGYLTAVAPLCGLVVGAVAGLIAEAVDGEDDRPELGYHQLSLNYYRTRDRAASAMAQVFWNYLQVTPSADPRPRLPNGNYLVEKGGKTYEMSPQLVLPWRPGTRLISFADAVKAAEDFDKLLSKLPKPENLELVRSRFFAIPPDKESFAPGTIMFRSDGVALSRPVNTQDINRSLWRTDPASQLTYREVLRFSIEVPSPDGRPTAFTHRFSWCIPMSFAAILLGRIRVLERNSCWTEKHQMGDIHIFPWFGDTTEPAGYEGALIQYQRWMGDCSDESSTGPGPGPDIDKRFTWGFGDETSVAFRGLRSKHLFGARWAPSTREGTYDLPSNLLNGAVLGMPGGSVHEFLVSEWLLSMALGLQTTFAPYIATKTMEIAAPFFAQEEKRKRAELLSAKRFECWRLGHGAEWAGNVLRCKALSAADVEEVVRASLATQPGRSPEMVRREMMEELSIIFEDGKLHPRWASYEAASRAALLPRPPHISDAVISDQRWAAKLASDSAAAANKNSAASPFSQAEYQEQVASDIERFKHYQSAGGNLEFGQWASAGKPAPAPQSGGGGGGNMALLLLPLGLLGALALGSRK